LKIDNNPFAKGFRENSDRSYENSILIQSNYNQDLIQPQLIQTPAYQSPYANQHNHHQAQQYQYYQYAKACQQNSNLYTSTPKMVSNTISYQMNHSPPTTTTMNQYYQQSMQSAGKKRSREEANEGESELIEAPIAKQACDQIYYNSNVSYGSQVVPNNKATYGSSSSLASSPSTSPSTANSLSNGVLSNSSPLSSFQY